VKIVLQDDAHNGMHCQGETTTSLSHIIAH
jgi:hypothetical protein